MPGVNNQPCGGGALLTGDDVANGQTQRQAGMEVAFDANGYPYDTSTYLLVNLEYDANGNAIDMNTGQIVDHVIAPDGSTVYSTATTPIAQIIQNVAAQLGRPPAIGYYPSGQQPYYYRYSPSATGAGAQVSLSPKGAGINLSPTTLLIIGVVAFAFLFGKGRR
jgi:hypothetical protein